MKTLVSQTFMFGSILAIVGGFLDSYTYLCRGEIFANAQTGNIIFLGLGLINGDYSKFIFYLAPVILFCLGVFLSEFFKTKLNNKKLHWQQLALLLEIFVLFSCAFIPSGTYDIFVNTAISFTCGVQVQSFKSLYGNAYATTMCTGNLRAGTYFLFLSINDKSMLKTAVYYFGIIFIFVLGVVLGAICTMRFNELSIIFAVLLLFIAFFLLNKQNIR